MHREDKEEEREKPTVQIEVMKRNERKAKKGDTKLKRTKTNPKQNLDASSLLSLSLYLSTKHLRTLNPIGVASAPPTPTTSPFPFFAPPAFPPPPPFVAVAIPFSNAR